jgi:hypothetical protein
VPEVHLNGVPSASSPPANGDTKVEAAAEVASPARHSWCSQFVESTSVHHSLAENMELRDRLTLFRAAGWRLEPPGKKADRKNVPAEAAAPTPPPPPPPPLPEDHCEVVPFLFSSYSAKSNVAPYYCIAPWVVNMGLYGNYDTSLGGFLEQFCFAPDYKCPNR